MSSAYKIYEVSDQVAAFLNAIASTEGDSSDELPPEVIADTLEALEGDYVEIVTDVLKDMVNNTGTADSLKAEAKRLTDRAKVYENRVAAAKDAIRASMNRLGKKKVITPFRTCTLNKGRLSTSVIDSKLVDSMYITDTRIEYDFDMPAVRQAFKDGNTPAGFEQTIGKSYLTIK